MRAYDDSVEIREHDLSAEPPQPPHQLLEELAHEAEHHLVQRRVRQQAVAVAAQVAVDGHEQVVGQLRTAHRCRFLLSLTPNGQRRIGLLRLH